MRRLLFFLCVGASSLCAQWHQSANTSDWVEKIGNKPFFDAREYGAKGDGVTDDTIAGQKCIDAAQAAGGGTCYFPKGVYINRRFKFWNGATAYSNIGVMGGGPGITTFRTIPGITPSTASTANTLELSDPADVSGANPTTRIIVVGLTLDGNKSNVTIPGGGSADDVSHNGIFSNQSTLVSISNVEAKNYWYVGVCAGLWSTHWTISNLRTSNNGYSTALWVYGGVLFGGSSNYNTLSGFTSNTDIIGLSIGSNSRYNNVSGTVKTPYVGVGIGDQGTAESIGNIVNVSVSGATGYGLIIGTTVGTTHHNIVTMTITGSGVTGALIDANAYQNTFNLSVDGSQLSGVRLLGHDNTIYLLASNNSQATPAAEYGLKCEAGALRNNILAKFVDLQGSATQNPAILQAGCNNNYVMASTFPNGVIPDSGTANTVNTVTAGTQFFSGTIFLGFGVDIQNNAAYYANDFGGNQRRLVLVSPGDALFIGDIDSTLGGDVYHEAKTTHHLRVSNVDKFTVTAAAATSQVPLTAPSGGTVPAWAKYSLVAIANGVNGCANANGCWQVNGVLGANKTAGLTQNVVLFALPSNGQVTDWRMKTATACTGATTALSGLGTTGNNVLFRPQTYDIAAAPGNTNLSTGPTAGAGADTAAGTNVVASLITTVQNVDQLVAGCAVDYSVLWAVIP